MRRDRRQNRRSIAMAPERQSARLRRAPASRECHTPLPRVVARRWRVLARRTRQRQWSTSEARRQPALQITMDDTFFVRRVECVSDLTGHRERVLDGHGTALDAIGQCLAFDKLEDERRAETLTSLTRPAAATTAPRVTTASADASCASSDSTSRRSSSSSPQAMVRYASRARAGRSTAP